MDGTYVDPPYKGMSGERNYMKKEKRTIDRLPTVMMGECLGSFRRRVQDKWAVVDKNRFAE